MVGQAVVSPTKMNVLYIGVDNPLAISASGFTADKVKPSCAGCALRADKKKGEYLARVSKVGKAVVNVGAIQEDGTTKKVGAQEFRIKRVPDPIATLGKKYTGGKIQSHILKAQRGVVADLRDFVFDLRFNVISFEMTFAAKGADLVKASAKGPALNQKMINIIKRAKKGDLVFFDEIKVRGPDKVPRKLPGIAFEVM
jgi:gliding motility-associated protein GldM